MVSGKRNVEHGKARLGGRCLFGGTAGTVRGPPADKARSRVGAMTEKRQSMI